MAHVEIPIKLMDAPKVQAAIREAAAEIERLRGALGDALAGCEVGAGMQCTCTGYYRCNGCVDLVAQQAEDTAELIRAALGNTPSAEACTCTRLGYGERDPQVHCPTHGITSSAEADNG